MGDWTALLLAYAVSLAAVALPILGSWLLVSRRERKGE